MQTIQKKVTSILGEQFEKYNELISIIILESYRDSITCYLNQERDKKGHAELSLPHGTFASDISDANVNISFLPSKEFKEILNGERNCFSVDYEQNETFKILFKNFNMYGAATEGTKKKRDTVLFDDDEIDTLIRTVSDAIALAGVEYAKPGKNDIVDFEGHGEYKITYLDNDVNIIFVPSETMTQDVKNDATHSKEVDVTRKFKANKGIELRRK